jgi:phage baseplate assembly protein W
MADLNHTWGADLAFSPSGDLSLVDGAVRSRQRILRRLMTGLGDYIWNLDYGAGVPRFIGSLIDATSIAATIRSQIMQEPAVARSPLPVITVTPIDGGVFVRLQFLSVELGVQETLQFNYTL